MNLSFIINLLMLLIAFAAPAAADQIRIAADRWCPVNCEPDSGSPGFMVEIAQIVFTESGHTVQYSIYPWARAVADARYGKIEGIVGAFNGDAPDFIFPANELGMISSNSFFIKNSSTWEYKGLSSLREVRLGAILKYDYGENINNYIQGHKSSDMVQIISGEFPLRRNIKMLLIGRIDVIVEAAPVFWHTAKQMKVLNKVKMAGEDSEPEKCYIAFSPALKKSKEYARILSDGVAILRQSGKLKDILDKYGLQDWK